MVGAETPIIHSVEHAPQWRTFHCPHQPGRLRGLGARAEVHPEMKAFAKQYGFEYRCHERGRCDRKAGEERSFWTVETNFLPGRTFAGLEDPNRQAFEWSATRLDNKPQGKAGLIPATAFEHERRYLVPVRASARSLSGSWTRLPDARSLDDLRYPREGRGVLAPACGGLQVSSDPCRRIDTSMTAPSSCFI